MSTESTHEVDLIPIRRFNSLLGSLISTGLHLCLLLLLTLLTLVPKQQAPLDLQFSVAASDSDTALESFELEPPESPVSTPDVLSETQVDDAVMDAGVLAVEPTLLDLDAVQAGPAKASGGGDGEAKQAPQPSRKKGSFFGTHAYGDEFVFVVDSSSSMLSPCGFRYGKTRFEVATQELMRSISSLEEDQKFCVFFFGLRTRVMFDGNPRLVNATAKNRARLRNWMLSLSPGEGTDPRMGVWQAIKLKPSAIFLLSDGEFNGRSSNFHQIPGNAEVEQIISHYRKRSVPIHTIAFEDTVNRRRLRNIAIMTAGSHRYIGSYTADQILLADLMSRNRVDVEFAIQGIIDEPRQVQNEKSMQAIAARLTHLMQSHRAPYRESAHYALLALAESLDVDTAEVDVIDDFDSPADINFAHATWVKIWKEHWKAPRGETRLTRVVSP